MEYVPRTFTLILEGGSATPEAIEHLEQFRDQPAYVLLGGPGSGKTTEFLREADRTGARYVSARDFIALHRDDWGTSTIFLDGLDEMRIGTVDPRKPLEQIRKKLSRIGSSKFRISCRDGEWLGGNDRRALAALTDGRDVPVLRINPLGPEEIQELLNAFLDSDGSQQFLDRSIQPTLQGLLGNPLTLRMLAEVSSHPGPHLTKAGAFKQACEQLAMEIGYEHQAATFGTGDRAAVLRTAEETLRTPALVGKNGMLSNPDLRLPKIAFILANWATVELNLSEPRPSVAHLRVAGCRRPLLSPSTARLPNSWPPVILPTGLGKGIARPENPLASVRIQWDGRRGILWTDFMARSVVRGEPTRD